MLSAGSRANAVRIGNLSGWVESSDLGLGAVRIGLQRTYAEILRILEMRWSLHVLTFIKVPVPYLKQGLVMVV